MATTVSTPVELGKAIKGEENEIVITGKLGDAVIAIQAVGPVSWVIASGAVVVAIAGVVAAAGTGGAGAPVSAVMEAAAAPALIGSFGSVSVSAVAIGIALAGGGVGALSTLRRYKAEKKHGNVYLVRR